VRTTTQGSLVASVKLSGWSFKGVSSPALSTPNKTTRHLEVGGQQLGAHALEVGQCEVDVGEDAADAGGGALEAAAVLLR
jgi:hypothetical protein